MPGEALLFVSLCRDNTYAPSKRLHPPFERSRESEIPRELWAIERSTDFLLEAYSEHSKFVVRWNGRTRDKAIRSYQDNARDPGRGGKSY